MILPRKVPVIQQATVYVREGVVEVWYSRPVSLGKVERVGHSWYTVDGKRHNSSRAAMRYLIREHEEGRDVRPDPRKPVPSAPRRGTRPVPTSEPGLPPSQARDILIDLDLSDPVVLGILRMLQDRKKISTNQTEQ